MRSFWVTGWLLVSLLVCSAADPRLAIAGAPTAPAKPSPDRQPPPTDSNPDQIRAAIALTGSARAQKIDELAAGWSRRKEHSQQTQTTRDQALAASGKHGAVAQAFPLKRDTNECDAPLVWTVPGYTDFPTRPALTPAGRRSGVALAVGWLVRSQASRGAPGHGQSALG